MNNKTIHSVLEEKKTCPEEQFSHKRKNQSRRPDQPRKEKKKKKKCVCVCGGWGGGGGEKREENKVETLTWLRPACNQDKKLCYSH